jgi:hypothetical protein
MRQPAKRNGSAARADRHEDALSSARIDRAQMLRRLDGWESVLTGLGTQQDKRTSFHSGQAHRLTFEECIELYRGNVFAAKVVDKPAADMTREWMTVQVKDEKQMGEDVDHWLQEIDAADHFRWALQRQAAVGGAGLVLGINQGQVRNVGAMMQPLDENAIDTIDFLTPYAARELQAVAYHADLLGPEPGLPAAYRVVPRFLFAINGMDIINFGANALPEAGRPRYSWAQLPEIHASRILRFQGIVVERRQLQENWGWGDSVFVRAHDILRDFGIGWASVANLLTDFAQATLAVPGLLESLAQDGGEKILARMALLDRTRSVSRWLPLDGGDVGTGAGAEVFKREVTSLTGVGEILREFCTLLAAAFDMPVTKLMGISPAGMNATGEHDTDNWHAHVRGLQERRMARQIRRLVALGFRAKKGPTGGVTPKTPWSIVFKPLGTPSEKELADARLTMAQADKLYAVDIGAVHPDEVRQSRFGGDTWQVETQLNAEETEGREAIAGAAPEPGAPAPTPVAKGAGTRATPQESAMNGGQISALVDILSKVRDASIAPKSAVHLLRVAFPSIDETAAREMVEAIEVKEQKEPAPGPIGQPPPGVLPVPRPGVVPPPKP